MDTSGPGPRPLSEVKKGGAGGAGTGGTGGAGDDAGGGGVQKESCGEGTGEKYVKSSGMAADGGDFDASNPGAGREADREFPASASAFPFASCFFLHQYRIIHTLIRQRSGEKARTRLLTARCNRSARRKGPSPTRPRPGQRCSIDG